MVCTPECLAPGNTPVPDVVLKGWKPTDQRAPNYAPGWLITAFDYDHTEYGRRATIEEWREAIASICAGQGSAARSHRLC